MGVVLQHQPSAAAFAAPGTNFITVCRIYELKGLVKSLADIADQDENLDHPIIETIQKTMNEVISLIEGGEN